MLIKSRAHRKRDWKGGGGDHAYAKWEASSAIADWKKFYEGHLDLREKRIIDLGGGLGGQAHPVAQLLEEGLLFLDLAFSHLLKLGHGLDRHLLEKRNVGLWIVALVHGRAFKEVQLIQFVSSLRHFNPPKLGGLLCRQD